jgi:glucokinase
VLCGLGKADVMLVCALDIGGSSVKHGVVEVNGDGAYLLAAAQSSPLVSRQFENLRSVVMDSIAGRLNEHPEISAVGISTTGSVDRSGVVVSAGHFDGYRDVSWSEVLTPIFRTLEHVETVNDGRASAWAEYMALGGREMSQINVVVGTGVGGGLVYNGELLLGEGGQAGYIGHIKVTAEPTARCSCGSTGCVEVLAAAPAVVRYWQEAGGISDDNENHSFSDVTAAALRGEESALSAFRRAGRWLGVGLGNAMNVLNPSVVSVGGGVLLASGSVSSAPAGGPYFEAVAEGLAWAAHRRIVASADLRMARFGNDGGLLGAAQLAARTSQGA